MTESVYKIPNWAGKPPAGLHLDVSKDGKLIQKLMIDEKKCYFFGRNPTLCDFAIDHASCSRVHSALVWHKHLNRAFLVDLGSTHGTFVGSVRLESQKPTQLPIDTSFHFGASTRIYTLREKPQQKVSKSDENEDVDITTSGLPESENELEQLTEYNTAQNRRIVLIGIPEDDRVLAARRGTKRKFSHVSFREEDEIINPEDVDPTVGKFRNLVQTTYIIPNARKQMKIDPKPAVASFFRTQISKSASEGFDIEEKAPSSINPLFDSDLSARLGIHLPNPAPQLDEDIDQQMDQPFDQQQQQRTSFPTQMMTNEATASESEPKRKKYVKEAWPGRKPNMLI